MKERYIHKKACVYDRRDPELEISIVQTSSESLAALVCKLLNENEAAIWRALRDEPKGTQQPVTCEPEKSEASGDLVLIWGRVVDEERGNLLIACGDAKSWVSEATVIRVPAPLRSTEISAKPIEGKRTK